MHASHALGIKACKIQTLALTLSHIHAIHVKQSHAHLRQEGAFCYTKNCAAGSEPGMAECSVALFDPTMEHVYDLRSA